MTRGLYEALRNTLTEISRDDHAGLMSSIRWPAGYRGFHDVQPIPAGRRRRSPRRRSCHPRADRRHAPGLALAMARALEAPIRPPCARRPSAWWKLASDSLIDQDVDAGVPRAPRCTGGLRELDRERIDGLLLETRNGAGRTRGRTRGRRGPRDGNRQCAGQDAEDPLCEPTASTIRWPDKIAQGPMSVDADRQVIGARQPGRRGVRGRAGDQSGRDRDLQDADRVKGRNALILSFHHHAAGVGQLTVRHRARGLEGARRACGSRAMGRSGRAAKRRGGSWPCRCIARARDRRSGRWWRPPTAPARRPSGSVLAMRPAWICADANLDRAARAIVASKTFDNGLVCGAEHNLVVDSRVAAPFARR